MTCLQSLFFLTYYNFTHARSLNDVKDTVSTGLKPPDLIPPEDIDVIFFVLRLGVDTHGAMDFHSDVNPCDFHFAE